MHLTPSEKHKAASADVSKDDAKSRNDKTAVMVWSRGFHHALNRWNHWCLTDLSLRITTSSRPKQNFGLHSRILPIISGVRIDDFDKWDINRSLLFSLIGCFRLVVLGFMDVHQTTPVKLVASPPCGGWDLWG
jgi:hypothetical protein